MDPRRIVYEEASLGSSWYTAGIVAGLTGHHASIARRARRMAHSIARLHREEWPLEISDSLDGSEALDAASHGQSWDTIADDLDYQDADEARAAAVAYAGEEAVEAIEQRAVGQEAYRLRVEEHLEWKAIAKQLDQGWLKTRKQARAYAEMAGEPWPVRRGVDHERGRKAYEMRLAGKEWSEIAEVHGCGVSNITMRARLYAKKNNQKWPLHRQVVYADETTELRNRGGRAYRMRFEDHKEWKDIGSALGLSAKNAILAAKLFAEISGDPWPIVRGFDPDLGEKSYTMFLEERMRWYEVGAILGKAPSTCSEHAKRWALKNRRPWPPSEHMEPTGKLAYEMRAAENSAWHHIGTALRRSRDFCYQAAQQWAEDNNLPWPPPVPKEHSPEARRLRLGEKCYNHRKAGKTWHSLTSEAGVSRAWACRVAREYAEVNKLPWPITLTTDDIDREAYDLRCQGLSWEVVAERQKAKEKTVSKRAQRHATKHNLPWPINVAPVRKSFSKRARQAYEMGYGDGRPWKEVAAELGYASDQSAMNCAQVYADRFGLPYYRARRRSSKKDPTRLRRAYELRRDTDMTWAAIGEALGYKTSRSSFTAALKWAGQEKLPWPPRRGGP